MSKPTGLDALFESGPFPHFEKSLGLFRPPERRVLPRILLAIFLGWVPLIVLVLGPGLNGNTSARSFVTDYGVHARSLVAAPLFILCELVTLHRLKQIVSYFVESGIIPVEERGRFQALIDSTRSLAKSTLVEIVAIAASFAIAYILLKRVSIEAIPDWYVAERATRTLSLAGIWYVFVSVPLLILLFLGWLWRVLLWGRFLFHVSKMKMRLVAAHPDHAGGLKFLNESIFGFMPVAFTIGLIVAGSAANRVAYKGATLDDLQKTVIGLLLAVMILFVGPSLVFVFRLHSEKVKGILRYGKLADAVGRQFEGKWFLRTEIKADALEVPDFSATTDLYGVVSNVYEMTVIPFELKALVYLAISTLLPFVPVMVMTIPLKELLHEVASLLL